MNDATTPWIDPELIAAGKLLQEKGLVSPDRTVASIAEVRAMTDRIGAFLGEGSVPLQNERDLSLPGPHGQVPCRLYLPDGRVVPVCTVLAPPFPQNEGPALEAVAWPQSTFGGGLPLNFPLADDVRIGGLVLDADRYFFYGLGLGAALRPY